MNQWLRLYREALHDPKIVTLTDRQHRAWVNCLMMSDDDGFLPTYRDIACHLRMTTQEAEQIITDLVEAGLIDAVRDGPLRFRMHGWERRQFRSDSSTERVKKHRNKSKPSEDATAMKRECNVSETPSYPDPDPEAEPEGYCPLPTEQEPAREKVVPMDLVRMGMGKGRSVSVEARRKVSAKLGLANADPLVALYESWPRSKFAQDPDALFIATAPKLLREASPEVKAACQPAPEPVTARPVPKASSALRASLARVR